VVLALGPIRSPVPADLLSSPHVRVERFRTAAELKSVLMRELPAADIVVMAAAVADFRPAATESGKLRRGESMALQLEPVEDLLSATRASRKPGARVIGFALEPRERLERSALDKLGRKDLDAIVANPLETMDAPDIDATLYFRDGRARRAASPGVAVPKEAFGRWLAAQALGLVTSA
jgi:phosphopantothenoylcysteine decarboxylase/phosphopantothenate--cysteine ligase